MNMKLKMKLKDFLENAKKLFKNVRNRSDEIITKIKNDPDSEVGTSPMAHWIVWATLAFFVVILIWAKFAVLEEVTVAEATVTPIIRIQSIQNMEGGIVKKIYVRENDIVEKGQILVELDPVRFSSALEEANARAVALQVKTLRLNAEVENKPLVISKELQDRFPKLVASEMNLYNLRQKQIHDMKKNYDLAQKEYALTKPLVAQGAASEVDAIHLERQVIGLEAQINEFHSQALAEYNAAKSDYESIQANIKALQDRLNRTVIRSPVKGIVKEIRLQTIGGVVLSGAEIMSIVPLEETLLVEAQVKPSSIGFIHLGADATVKITAYNYSVYGGLPGKVYQISADTMKTEQGKMYYLVRIKTMINYLGSAKNPLYIIPGMTATVNIVTGKKTVLDYILSPITRASENAMREK